MLMLRSVFRLLYLLGVLWNAPAVASMHPPPGWHWATGGQHIYSTYTASLTDISSLQTGEQGHMWRRCRGACESRVTRLSGLSGEELTAAGRSCSSAWGLITQNDAGLIKTKDQALSVGPLKVWSGTSLNGSMSYLITGGRWSTTTAPWCFNAASLMQTNMFSFWICVICASNHVCESDLHFIYTSPGWWRSSYTSQAAAAAGALMREDSSCWRSSGFLRGGWSRFKLISPPECWVSKTLSGFFYPSCANLNRLWATLDSNNGTNESIVHEGEQSRDPL